MEKNIIRKKKKKFDRYGFLKEYYLEDGIAYIPIKINSIEDIISGYSLENYEILNREFTRYVEINANYIPWGYPLTLEIHSTWFSKEEKEIIQKVIKSHYSLMLMNKKEELRDERLRGLYLTILGVITFIVYLVLSSLSINPAPIEIMSFLFWLSLWEAFDIEVLSASDIKDEIKDLEYLANMNIIYELEPKLEEKE